MSTPSTYRILDVAHALRVTPARAHDLYGLADIIGSAEVSSLLLHTLHPLLRVPDPAGRPPDDFSTWVADVLREPAAAERAALACAESSAHPERLRAALVSVLRLGPNSQSAPEHEAFRMHAADTVNLTEVEVEDPAAMCEELATASTTVWFWHLFEEPFRSGEEATILQWLRTSGESRLADRLALAVRTSPSLEALQSRAIGPWRRACLARNLFNAETRPARQRPDESTVIRRLARRIVHGQEQE